jgi:hypothetical protein
MAILTRLSISMSLQTIDAPIRVNEQSFLTPLSLLPAFPHHSDLEERRRVFWAIFLLDRFIATSTGWTLSLSEKDIRAKLPCLELEFQMSREYPAKYFTQYGLQSETTSICQADLWAFCIESAGGLGRVMTWLRIEWNIRNVKSRQRREMDGFGLVGKLEGWWRGLPERFKKVDGDENVGGIILLHATYYTYGSFGVY